MTKIITEGNLPVKRMTCDYCGCEFEYDKRDVRKERRTMPDYVPYSAMPMNKITTTYAYSVACPNCQTEHSLPSDILDQLKAENPRKDFEEDVRALAKQYGLTVKSVEVE